MYNTACVVNVRLPGKKNCQDGSCCGLLLDTDLGLVLAHGSCLGVFVEQDQFDPDKPQFTIEDVQRFECEVLLQNVDRCGDLDKSIKKERVTQTAVSSFSTETGMAGNEALPQRERDSIQSIRNSGKFYAFTKFPAEILDFFQSKTVADSLGKLVPEPSWELLDRKDSKQATDNNNNTSSRNNAQVEESMQKLLSSFIVMKLRNWEAYQSSLGYRPTSKCRLGEKVEICSTPFAGLKPDTFLNSLSRGVVSNLAGKDNCLLLSDARCILGGEGAPLYTFDSDIHTARCLTGIVIVSLSWKNDEWVGLCIACDVGAVLKSGPPYLQRLYQTWQRNSSTPSKYRSLQPDLPCPEVALLKVGQTWGSGVVVDQERGLILTCSHVIREAHLYPVQAKRRGQMSKAKVIFRQHPLQHQFDLAVVQDGDRKARNQAGTPVTIATPSEGMEVFVVGHALFGEEHDLQPCVTSGIISKVIRVNNIPVMIQTTCAVHPGASGGALVDTTGRLLGIVVCNARDNTSGASFPHINMSVPVCTVWQVISNFFHSEDVRHLERLVVKNTLLDTIWSLGPAQDTGSSHVQSKL